jgi:hypothetical protein
VSHLFHSRPPAPTIHRWVVCWFAVCLCVGSFCFEALAEDPPSEPSPSFERDVRPILKASCFHCHGEEETLQGGLDVRLVRLMHKGGDSGPSVVPGDPAASLVWRRIELDEMPAGSKKLSAAQKETIRAWIQAGAQTLRAEPENVEDARLTPEELDFWAFQPPRKTEIPFVPSYKNVADATNPIDAFIRARLAIAELDLSPEADRATLIRRLKLDLHGLPPTPEEVDAFVADPSETAYENLVDRWLESPDYGVRWARHWLDVAGYSETDGNPTKDTERQHAWRYRDYVIDSLNRDKPYDQFLLEQLAGDECIEGDPDPENERHVELMTATGFLRMAPDITATNNGLLDRNQAVADMIKVVGSSVLGLSVGCAQCHDHRYDPITIEDYYRYRAIFDPAFPLSAWHPPDQRLIDLTPAADRAAADAIEAEAVRREKDLAERKREVGQKILDMNLAATPENVRESLVGAIAISADKQTEEQKKLLLEYPMVRSVDAIVGQLIEFDKVNNNENYKRFVEETKEIDKYRQTKPPARRIMAVRDRIDVAPESKIFFRGDPEQPTKRVDPAEVYVLARERSAASIPSSKSESSRSFGRRSAYVKQLTDGTHPLVARVAVNRLWQHHFGVGLVSTPGDFGSFGQRPTHPELLDWLACDFVEGGWRLKRIHKLMVSSHTYRQQSRRNPTLDQIDPDNRLYGRANLNRLDAETIRDSMLSVSGDLNPRLGGPSVPVAEDGEGQATLGRRILNEGLYAGIEDIGSEKYRRSIYLQSKRGLPLSLLETFDMPAMNPNCDARRCSTVAPQALLFLNEQSIIQFSEKTAQRLWSETPEPQTRIARLFLKLFSKSPTDPELASCQEYLASQREVFAADPNPDWRKRMENESHAPDLRALASLCQVLMASNRFLYVD